MRKTTAKMGGLCAERSEEGRKMQRKCQQQGAMEKITKVALQQGDK